ncbi:MAG TPA: FAD-dependent monooxygenase [Stellaceae bacterium]
MTAESRPPAKRHSVIIVGGGPIGLCLAADLGSRGVDCVLLEQTDNHTRSARIMQIAVSTMEICRRFGIAEKVKNWGFPRDYPWDNVWMTSLNGYELGRVKMASLAETRASPFSPEFQCHCPQTWFEPILRDAAMSYPSATFRFHTRLDSFVQDGDGVRATVTDLAAGTTEEIAADYLVGCDGYSSSVRQALGIRMRGLEFIDHSLSIEFLTPDLPGLHNKGKALRYVCIGPEGTWASLMAVNGRDRWRVLLYGLNEDPEAVDAAAVVRRICGRDFDFTIESAKPWERRAVIADRFQDGRVFIAGDAAHTHLPNGGFGMNTGLGDAINLGWKLAAVVEGWAAPHLLDSYDIERRPICHRVMDEAMTEFHRFTGSPSNPHIDAPTKQGARVRQTIGDQIQSAYEKARGWDRLGIYLGHIYCPSPIVVDDGTALPPDDTYGYAPSAHPGARAPHAWLDDGRSLLDLFGQTYVLLRLGANPPDAPALKAAAAARGVTLAVHEVASDEVAALYGCTLVLVRPDGHVAWRGDADPGNALAIIDRIRGAGIAAAARVALAAGEEHLVPAQ